MPTEIYLIKMRPIVFPIFQDMLHGLAFGFRTGRVSVSLSFDL
jgi:hypothetical protein